VNALFNLGLALGALAQGWLADKVGRKKAFMLAAVCTLIGAALVTGSVAIGMLITVRLLHGFGLGMLVGLVPLYLTETAPARSRGLLLCINTSCISIGYFVYVLRVSRSDCCKLRHSVGMKLCVDLRRDILFRE
jgi:MFS family permease